MKSVGCTLTLKSNVNLTCDLAITLDDQGRQTWKRIDSPQRRLRFGTVTKPALIGTRLWPTVTPQGRN